MTSVRDAFAHVYYFITRLKATSMVSCKIRHSLFLDLTEANTVFSLILLVCKHGVQFALRGEDYFTVAF